MPPSPSLRISPGREMRTDNHKRGRSLEGGLLFKDKDDDLTLFSEMQNRETDNFLLDTNNDFDDSLSTKLRYFSDFKLGISIPARGESSDLLNVDGDKNDYDWLLTPPDTPLFPSLDDDPPSINLSHRGRPRSQPISIARSATTEKSNRTSRSSASPHRLSPSPRSSNTTLQSRGRPLSASHSGSTPILRPTTPSRSPSRSTTPNKTSIPAPRSSTPTPRRLSTGSSVTAASSGRVGTSPVKTSRGNSASPKLRAWQSTIPGFSTEAPPNLRTSLSDRPASYVRGSSPASSNGRGLSPTSSNGRGLSPVSSNARGLSPASRNGRESSTKRQSMSPTASRSVSSSCSHDRDHFSSHSKGSVASSGDDDIDSLQSFNLSISDRSAVRKVGAFPSSRAQGLSKKPSRVLSSSAPKRSFDSALRQMDRRSPQNMFRPLLSSVPSTTFYAGKVTSTQRPVISRNSSITTSSNASSEQGASFAPDIEGDDHDQDHREQGKVLCPDLQDEVFTIDNVDEINEDVGHEAHDEESISAQKCFVSNEGEVDSGVSESAIRDIAAAVVSESTRVHNELLEANCNVTKVTCSKCGRDFNVTDSLDDVCPDCIEKVGCLPVSIPEMPVVTKSSTDSDLSKENKYFDELHSEELVLELQEFASSNEAMLIQDETDDGKEKNSLSDSFLGKSIEEGEIHFVDQQVLSQVTDGSNHNYESVDQQLPPSNAYPSLMVDVPQGVGISVLLKKSSSNKWPVVQGRTFTASSTPLDDLSYARDSMNSMRSSIGHGSASTSSSVDLSTSRQTDTRVQRQLSCRKADMENSRYGTNRKALSRGSSFSGISNHSHHAMAFDVSTSEENFDICTGKVEFDVLEETPVVSDEKAEITEMDSLARTAVCEDNQLDCIESCGMMDSPRSEPLSDTSTIHLMETSLATFPDENHHRISSCNTDDLTNIASNSDEVSISNQGPVSIDEDAKPNDDAHGVDIIEEPPHDSSVMRSGEVGMDHTSSSQNDESTVPPNPEGIADELQQLLVPSEKDVPVSASESCIVDHAHDILEESTVTIGVPGHNSRSLTLEEATDTILFCSSIIQNLAYQAATIGMEKEHMLSLEGSRPTVTLLGKSSPDRKDPRGRSGNKRTPKPNKSRQKRIETTDVGNASPKTESDTKTQRSVPHDLEVPNRVDSARPLKPESKCNCTVM